MTETPETNAARRSSGLRAIADGLRANPDLSVAQKVICDAAVKIEELERERDEAREQRDRLEDERNERNELTEAIQLKLSRIIELTTHDDIYWAIEEIGRLSLTNPKIEQL
jgi:hypothetical protein